MKYPNETETAFDARRKDAKRRGVLIWRNDAVREQILDMIYDYLDILDLLDDNGENV